MCTLLPLGAFLGSAYQLRRHRNNDALLRTIIRGNVTERWEQIIAARARSAVKDYLQERDQQ